jgi:shikimate kinase
MIQANIVITGFMGTGKSTVAPIVAEKMARQFIDTDDLIIEQAGKSIPEIFASDGEPRFRKLEAEVCVDLAAQTNLVIATGGGALLNPDTLAAMSAMGMVVCLTANETVLEQRLTSEERAGRPLAKNWRDLYNKRKPAYDVIPYQVNTDNKTPEQIAEEIIALWQSVFT